MALKGQHKHKCKYCGLVWNHTDRAIKSFTQNIKAHNCPNPICGEMQYSYYEGDEESVIEFTGQEIDLELKREFAAKYKITV